MSAINPDVFQKFKNARKLPTRQEGDGHAIEVEVREDEEQSEKLEIIIDLLVAAGYFRARIKGLSPFDKIVGGMTWCMESCNMDVDVDLLFQENSTIGQKIALTEKIVKLLPKLKCPHNIEPHQIQGLDFIHIHPVIQWLVKRSMEFREERSAFVRAFAINQFQKEFGDDTKKEDSTKPILDNIHLVNELYRPQRYFKRKNAPPPDIDSRVQITLLEYGAKSDINNAAPSTDNKQKTEELLHNLTNEVLIDYEDLNEEERLTLAKHYEVLQLELRDGGVEAKEKNELLILSKQFEFLNENIRLLEAKKDVLGTSVISSENTLKEIRAKQNEADKTLKELEESSEGRSQASIKEVEELVILNDNLNSQEVQFREQCKQELARLQNLIKESKSNKSPLVDYSALNSEIESESEHIRIIRLKLAKKNRIVAGLQRQLDEVPNRAELAQYQRRFLELYNQIAAKYKETKQYYTLFNTLEDTRLYMKKELSLLNSISESYPEARQSQSGKDEFLKQFQLIVDGVRQSKLKVEARLAEQKRKRDEFSRHLQTLIEIQRKYVNTVSQLSLECKKHEALMTRK